MADTGGFRFPAEDRLRGAGLIGPHGPMRGPRIAIHPGLDLQQWNDAKKVFYADLMSLEKRVNRYRGADKIHVMNMIRQHKRMISITKEFIRDLEKEEKAHGKAAAAARSQTKSLDAMGKELKQTANALDKTNQGIKEQTASINQAKHSFSTFSKALGTSITLWYTARTAIYAVRNAIEQTMKVYNKGVAAIDDFRMSVIGAAAIMGPHMKEGATAAERMGHAVEFATDIMKQLELVAVRHVATGRSLQMVWEAMAVSGIFATEKDVENIAKLADYITLYTKGQRLEVQLMQEVRGLMDGQVRTTNKLAYMLDNMLGGTLKQHLQLWKEMGTTTDGQLIILQKITDMLGDIGNLQDMILGTTQTWKNTLETAFTKVLRLGALEYYERLGDVFEWLSRYLLDFSDQANEFSEGLTTQGHLVVDILREGWERLEDIITATLGIDATEATLTKGLWAIHDYLERSNKEAETLGYKIRNIFKWIEAAAGPVITVFKIFFLVSLPKWIAKVATVLSTSLLGPLATAGGLLEGVVASFGAIATTVAGWASVILLVSEGMKGIATVIYKHLSPETKKFFDEVYESGIAVGEVIDEESNLLGALDAALRHVDRAADDVITRKRTLLEVIDDLLVDIGLFDESARSLGDSFYGAGVNIEKGGDDAAEVIKELGEVLDTTAEEMYSVTEQGKALGDALGGMTHKIQRSVKDWEKYWAGLWEFNNVARAIELLSDIFDTTAEDMRSVIEEGEALADALSDVSYAAQNLMLFKFDDAAMAISNLGVELTDLSKLQPLEDSLEEYGKAAVAQWTSIRDRILRVRDEQYSTMSEQTRDHLIEELKVLLEILKEEKKAREDALKEAEKIEKKRQKELEKQLREEQKALEKKLKEEEKLRKKFEDEFLKREKGYVQRYLKVMETLYDNIKEFGTKSLELGGLQLFDQDFSSQGKAALIALQSYADQYGIALGEMNEHEEKRVKDFIKNWSEITKELEGIEKSIAIGAPEKLMEQFAPKAETVGEWRKFLDNMAEAYDVNLTDMTETTLEFIQDTRDMWEKYWEDIHNEAAKVWERMWENFQKETGNILYDLMKDWEGTWSDLLDRLGDILLRWFSDKMAAYITLGLQAFSDLIAKKLEKGAVEGLENAFAAARTGILGNSIKESVTNAVVEGFVEGAASTTVKKGWADAMANFFNVGAQGTATGTTGGVGAGAIMGGMAAIGAPLLAGYITYSIKKSQNEREKKEREEYNRLVLAATDALESANEQLVRLSRNMGDVEIAVREFNEETQSMKESMYSLYAISPEFATATWESISETRSKTLKLMIEKWSGDFFDAMEGVIDALTMTDFGLALKELGTFWDKAVPDAAELDRLGKTTEHMDLLVKALSTQLVDVFDTLIASAKELSDEVDDLVALSGATAIEKELYDLSKWGRDADLVVKDLRDSVGDLRSQVDGWRADLLALDPSLKGLLETQDAARKAVTDAENLLKTAMEPFKGRGPGVNPLWDFAESMEILITAVEDGDWYSIGEIPYYIQELARGVITARGDLSSATAEYNAELAKQPAEIRKLATLIDWAEGTEGVEGALDILNKKIIEAVDDTTTGMELIFGNIVSGWEAGVQGIIDDLTLTPYEKALKEVTTWFETETKNIKAIAETELEIANKWKADQKKLLRERLGLTQADLSTPMRGLSFEKMEAVLAYQAGLDDIDAAYKAKLDTLFDVVEAERLLNEAYGLRLEDLEKLKDASNDLSAAMEEWQDIIDKNTMSEYAYEFQRLNKWFEDGKQRILDQLDIDPEDALVGMLPFDKLFEYLEAMGLLDDAYKAQLDILREGLVDEITSFSRSLDEVLTKGTMSDIAYQFWLLDNELIDLLKDANMLEDAARLLGVSVEDLTQKVKDATEAQKTALIEEAYEGFSAEITDIIDKHTLSEFDYEMKQISDWRDKEQTQIEALLAVAKDQDQIARLTQLLVDLDTAAGYLIDDLGEDGVSGAVQELYDAWNKIIAENTLGDVAYELAQLNWWYEQQQKLAKDLGADINLLNQAYQVQRDTIREDIAQEIQDVLDEFTLTDAEKEFKRVDQWYADQVSNIEAAMQDILTSANVVSKIQLPIDQLMDYIALENLLAKAGVAAELWRDSIDTSTDSIIDELDRFNRSIRDIINEHTFSDLGNEFLQVNQWYRDQLDALKAIGLDETSEDFKNAVANLIRARELQQAAIEEGFLADLDDIIAQFTLDDVSLQIRELNKWYVEQKHRASDLGIGLDKVNQAYQLQLEAIQKLRVQGVIDLKKSVEEYLTSLERVEWGIPEYENLFTTLLEEFGSLDKSSLDYYDDSLDVFARMFDTLQTLEGLSEDQIARIDELNQVLRDTLDSIDEAIRGFSIDEALAPVLSLEGMRAEYERLRAAAITAGPEDVDEAVAAFLEYAQGPYIEFMKAYSDDYKTVVQGVTDDMRALKDSLHFIPPPAEQDYWKNFITMMETFIAEGTIDQADIDKLVAQIDYTKETAASLEELLLKYDAELDVLKSIDLYTKRMDEYFAIKEEITKLQELKDQAEASLHAELTALGILEAELVKIQMGISDLVAMGAWPQTILPAGQTGGLMSSPTIGGEAGPEWFVPTYEPERSKFLSDVGASPELIADALAEKLGPYMSSGRVINISIDGREIASVVVDNVSKNPDLARTIKRVSR